MNTDDHHSRTRAGSKRQNGQGSVANLTGARGRGTSEGHQHIPMLELILDFEEQKQCPLPERPRHPEGSMPTVPLHTRQGPEVRVSDAAGFEQGPALLLFHWVPGLGVVLCSLAMVPAPLGPPTTPVSQSRVPPPPTPTSHALWVLSLTSHRTLGAPVNHP